MESVTSASSAAVADTETSGKPRLWSVAAELLLLVLCFIFAIYTAQSEPRGRVARPAGPAQQTQGPRDGTPPLSEPPPRSTTSEAVAAI